MIPEYIPYAQLAMFQHRQTHNATGKLPPAPRGWYVGYHRPHSRREQAPKRVWEGQGQQWDLKTSTRISDSHGLDTYHLPMHTYTLYTYHLKSNPKMARLKRKAFYGLGKFHLL